MMRETVKFTSASANGSNGSLASLEQRTLAASFERSGVGLHSGALTTVRVGPAKVNEGRYFVRTDQPGAPVIPARVESVVQTRLSTELAVESARVRTVEHLLAALAGMGVTNAQIEIDGPEVPLLDGSAQGWVEAIAQIGLLDQGEPRPSLDLDHPVWVQAGDAFVAAMPAAALKLTYGIEFDVSAIGTQWQSWTPDVDPFQQAIAPARTFGLAHQIEALQQQGLIKGGSLDNALVCDTGGWLNPPLRFSNEPVRHKLLDLIGDLSLVPARPNAHIVAYKASHHLHVQLAAALAQIISS